MRKLRRLPFLILAGAFVFSVQLPAQKTVVSDETFAKKAAIGGMTEVEASRVALQKTADARVRQFAQRMVDDHTKAGEALKVAAAAQGITLPTGLDSEHKDIVDKLRGLSGAEFDKAYKTQMLDDHKTTVAMFEDKVKENPKTPIGKFAGDTLPTLRSHLKMAEELAGSAAKTNR
jgi:putative membrane protein